MVAAVTVSLYHFHQKLCKIIGIGRRTDLVVHYTHRSPFLSQAQHGFDEILSVNAEYPGNADSKEFLHILLYCNLTLIFCQSINI